MANSLVQIPLRRIDGREASLGDYEGEVLLIVNVASQCGKTPQYEGLERLYGKYRDRGFEVLGFPSNQFGEQEPGSNEEIAEFCRSVYGVDFPMFAKIDVNGADRHPLYATLIAEQPERRMTATTAERGIKPKPGSDVRWNFEKFLVDRTGAVVGRFDPDVTPNDPELVKAVERELDSVPSA
jgi:glutathione peroxidase